MLLNNLSLFLLIVEKGSLVAASRELGISATTVSERLATLEAHYGVTLLNRTTRSISLTDAGKTLVSGAKLILAEVDELDGRMRHGADTLSGPIRVSASSDIGRTVVSPLIEQFLDLHPAISIEMLLSDGYVDIVGGGIDVALRFGDITDSTLRVRSLGSVRRVVCAAPSYLKQYGTPNTPEDLAQHSCILMRFGQSLDNMWVFRNDGTEQTIKVDGTRITNDGALARSWAVRGHGIVMKSELDVAQDIAGGRLLEVLAPCAAPAKPLHMLFPPGRSRPRRVSAFATALSDTLSEIMSARTSPKV